MFRPISIALTVAVLASTAAAQIFCGGNITLTSNNTFSAVYYPANNFTLLTMLKPANGQQSVLYCGIPLNVTALTTYGLSSNIDQFKVPVSHVATTGTFTPTYVELIGSGSSISFMDDPQLVVSPCLQQSFANKTLSTLDPAQYSTQFAQIDAAFLMTPNPGEAKAVYVPESLEVEPLDRVEYIIAISLFYGLGEVGQSVYTKITNNYGVLKSTVAGLPADQRKRISWVEYNFSSKWWQIRNSEFTRAIINDAGGISFPLRGANVTDRSQIDLADLKTMFQNSWVVIDQTNFTGQLVNQGLFNLWRSLADVTMYDLPEKRIYSLSYTYSSQGVSDYDYRAPARPDLLLQDLIHAQYPTFKAPWTFLDPNFASGGASGNSLTAAMCGQVNYNDGQNITIYNGAPLAGDGTLSPPLVGSGIYGAESGSSGSAGKKSKTPIIVAVVVVAVVIGAAFAFAFFKWGKRAKEDRFIELEEEMNNDIPLN